LKQLEQIENDKKRHLKDLRGFENPQNLVGKALTDSEFYKEWKKEVTAEYNDRIDALKESLSEQYAEEKQEVLNDYPIFMAIAEDIGYDATGKPTKRNELSPDVPFWLIIYLKLLVDINLISLARCLYLEIAASYYISISQELARFIQAIESGKDSFF